MLGTWLGSHLWQHYDTTFHQSLQKYESKSADWNQTSRAFVAVLIVRVCTCFPWHKCECVVTSFTGCTAETPGMSQYAFFSENVRLAFSFNPHSHSRMEPRLAAPLHFRHPVTCVRTQPVYGAALQSDSSHFSALKCIATRNNTAMQAEQFVCVCVCFCVPSGLLSAT